MFLLVALEIVPEFVGQGVLLGDTTRVADCKPLVRNLAAIAWMQDVSQCGALLGKLEILQTESRLFQLLAETDDKNPLAVLGRPVPTVDHPTFHVVAQLLKRILDDPERVPLVVADKVAHVLQQERRGLVMLQDFGDVEE
ncbi:hypothetical protein D3C71_1735760 [compost metagenome]